MRKSLKILTIFPKIVKSFLIIPVLLNLREDKIKKAGFLTRPFDFSQIP